MCLEKESVDQWKKWAFVAELSIVDKNVAICSIKFSYFLYYRLFLKSKQCGHKYFLRPLTAKTVLQKDLINLQFSQVCLLVGS